MNSLANPRKVRSFFIKLAFLVIYALPLYAHGQENELLIGEEHSLYAQALGEERSYWVSLPESYEQDDFYVGKQYPLLILLDADTHFQMASAMVKTMSAAETEQIPEMIVVGVRNTERTRDMTPSSEDSLENTIDGGSTDFLHFLEAELLPELEKKYRLLPYQLLIGHSLAGLFTVEAFLKHSTFDAYLAIDPSLHWADQLMVKRAETILEKDASFHASMFVSQANNPFNEGRNAGKKGESVQSFLSYLDKNASPSLRYGYQFFAEEDHFSVPLISLFDGLKFIYEGYKFPLNTIAEQSVAEIQKHYEQFAERREAPFLPPGKLLNQVGYFLLDQEGKTEEAIALFKLNTQYYPNSYIPYQSLAEAYRIKGDHRLALQNYQEALGLNPESEHLKNAIRFLEQK